MASEETRVCDYCGEPVGPDAVRRGDKVYCCQACAYEASRSVDCAGRSDTTMSSAIVAPDMRDQ